MPDNSKIKIKIDNITLSFGSVQALVNVSLDVYEGEFISIIGPNGSGKTSLLNSISGYYHPQKGDISIDDKSVIKLPVHQRAHIGHLGRTFQNIELYPGLNVVETLLGARTSFFKTNTIDTALYFGRAHREEKRHRGIVEEIIDFLGLQPERYKSVGALPFGSRRKVALGVALSMEPEVLLLDEPLAGMNIEEKEDVVRFILDIHKGGELDYDSEILRQGVKTIVLVEHDMGVVMDVAQRIMVLDFGHKIAEGTPAEIGKDHRVISAYLGEEF